MKCLDCYLVGVMARFLIRVGFSLYRGRKRSLLIVLSLLSVLFASALLMVQGLLEIQWNVHGDVFSDSVAVTAGGAAAVPTGLVSEHLIEDLMELEGTSWVSRETVAPCVVRHRGVEYPLFIRGVESEFWNTIPLHLYNESSLELGVCFVGARTGFKVGDQLVITSTFTVNVKEVRVAGIVTTGVASLDHQIYVPRLVANALRGIYQTLSSCARAKIDTSLISPQNYREIVVSPHTVTVRITGLEDPSNIVISVYHYGSIAEFETDVSGIAVLQLPFGDYIIDCGDLTEPVFLRGGGVSEIVFDSPEGFIRRPPQPAMFWWESETFYNFDLVLDRLGIVAFSSGSAYTSRVFGDLRIFLVTLALVILATVGLNVSGLLAEVVTKNRETVKTLFILGGRMRDVFLMFLVPLCCFSIISTSIGYVIALFLSMLLTDVLILDMTYMWLTIVMCTGLGIIVVGRSLRHIALTASLTRKEVRSDF